MKQLLEQNAKLTEDANEFKVTPIRFVSFRFEEFVLQDRYKRALAETENTRVRFNKMVNDAKVFGIQSFCKDLLEVADILNMALTNTPKEISSDVKVLAKDFTNLHQGLAMTEETNAEDLRQEQSDPNQTERRRQIRSEFSRRAFSSEIARQSLGNGHSSDEDRLSTAGSRHSSGSGRSCAIISEEREKITPNRNERNF